MEMARRSRNLKSHVTNQARDWLSVLPFELIELTADHLSARDLHLLRLMNRNLHVYSRRPLFKTYVTTYPFLLLNQDSMDQLVNMAKDPNKQQCLHCITLSHLALLGRKEDYAR